VIMKPISCIYTFYILYTHTQPAINQVSTFNVNHSNITRAESEFSHPNRSRVKLLQSHDKAKPCGHVEDMWRLRHARHVDLKWSESEKRSIISLIYGIYYIYMHMLTHVLMHKQKKMHTIKSTT
jgi:hypothetical protein